MIRHFLIFMLMAGVRLAGQEKREEPPPIPAHEQIAEIVTDRPDVTEAATVVPRGSLQFENGVSWTRAAGRSSVDLSQTLLRFGVTPRWEARIEVPDFFDYIGDPA